MNLSQTVCYIQINKSYGNNSMVGVFNDINQKHSVQQTKLHENKSAKNLNSLKIPTLY